MPAAEAVPIEQHLAACSRCVRLLRLAGIELPGRATAAPAAPHDTLNTGPAASQAQSPTGHDVTRAHAAISPSESSVQKQTSKSGISPPERADEVGRIGGYRLLRPLGEGGMGVVYEAEDLKLGRRVAIKMLRPGELDPALRKRFLQEAQLAASLSNDHIVTIYQVGEVDDTLFIVMELLRGESLETRLARDASLSLAESLRIAREVAEGLAAAHEQQLVHRDIKPANVWLEDRRTGGTARRVKLLDFGIARTLAVHEHLTLAGQVIGTPSYMSPEQACGLPTDQRSDLFSLGGLLYVMLTGQPPFGSDNYLQVLRAVADSPRRTFTNSYRPSPRRSRCWSTACWPRPRRCARRMPAALSTKFARSRPTWRPRVRCVP